MFDFLHDNRTQLQIMLDELRQNPKGVRTDRFKNLGIRDARSVKYRLTMKGWKINVLQKRKKKNKATICEEGTYILAGKICPRKKEKRDYIGGFTIEEIESELFKRDKIMSYMINGELCHLIK